MLKCHERGVTNIQGKWNREIDIIIILVLKESGMILVAFFICVKFQPPS